LKRNEKIWKGLYSHDLGITSLLDDPNIQGCLCFGNELLLVLFPMLKLLDSIAIMQTHYFVGTVLDFFGVILTY
jgi:hypothetical protein